MSALCKGRPVHAGQKVFDATLKNQNCRPKMAPYSNKRERFQTEVNDFLKVKKN